MQTPPFFATQGHLMLCQNVNCLRRGAGPLHAALTAALEREHLMYYKQGGTLRYTTSGCLGACSYGPVLACYRQNPRTPGALEQAWYFGVTLPRALELARTVQAGEALPLEGRFDALP